VTLIQHHDRVRQGRVHAPEARPEIDGPRVLALARRDPEIQTVSFVLDATTTNIAIHAIAAHADERESHVREVERFGQSLPKGLYGRRSRQEIAARETRVTTRLRAVEQASREATEREAAYGPPEGAPAVRSSGREADREVELEQKAGSRLPVSPLYARLSPPGGLMSGPEHYQEADRILVEIKATPAMSNETSLALCAQAHAILALAAATAIDPDVQRGEWRDVVLSRR
jgi:hypothetical protein